MGARVPIRTVNGTLFWGVLGACSSGRIFRFHIEHVKLKYLTNHKRGGGRGAGAPWAHP